MELWVSLVRLSGKVIRKNTSCIFGRFDDPPPREFCVQGDARPSYA